MVKRPGYRRRKIKRGRICEWSQEAKTLEDVAARVKYTGNSVHKTYPSPAGPPARYADKTKCDQYANADWCKLEEALRKAIRAGFVSDFQGDFPRRAWVWINGVLHEARLTNSGNGDYHGFPIDDPRQYPEPIDRLEAAPSVQIPVIRG